MPELGEKHQPHRGLSADSAGGSFWLVQLFER